MKRKTFSRLLMLLGLPVLVGTASCSQECLSAPVQEDSQKETETRISTLLEKFYASVHPETRGARSPFHISTIDTRTFGVQDLLPSESTSTRAGDDEEFTLHTVTMEFPDASGFAIVADDPRIDKVFFFTEHGEIGDTAFIAPLKELVDFYPTLAAEMIAEPDMSTATRSSSSITLISNILRCSWGQNAPFNNCAPYCTCEKCSERGNHQLAGCVTAAVAQYLSNRGVFNGTYYPNNNLDFTSFGVDRYSMTSVEQSKIANYYREIAHNCQIKFGCDGSSGQPSAVVGYLHEIGINCELIQNTLTPEAIHSELAKGIPHIVSGSNSEVGHMWLVTGIRPETDGNVGYYCNWGWDGRCNGWTVGNYYTPNFIATSYPKNIKHIYTHNW